MSARDAQHKAALRRIEGGAGLRSEKAPTRIELVYEALQASA
jgi:hypothetical protein